METVPSQASLAVSQSRISATVRQQLAAARDRLTDPDDEELGLYEDFLGRDELGLALDALADVATAQRAPGEVWEGLWSAAQTMELTPNQDVPRSALQRISDHLAAAHELRGLRRLLNEWDPIGVRPESGGQADEYSCLYAPLLERLASGEDAAQIAQFLRTELEGHFGLDADHSRPESFASHLVDWFTDGAPA